jgi:hypothetical protein
MPTRSRPILAGFFVVAQAMRLVISGTSSIGASTAFNSTILKVFRPFSLFSCPVGHRELSGLHAKPCALRSDTRMALA